MRLRLPAFACLAILLACAPIPRAWAGEPAGKEADANERATDPADECGRNCCLIASGNGPAAFDIVTFRDAAFEQRYAVLLTDGAGRQTVLRTGLAPDSGRITIPAAGVWKLQVVGHYRAAPAEDWRPHWGSMSTPMRLGTGQRGAKGVKAGRCGFDDDPAYSVDYDDMIVEMWNSRSSSGPGIPTM